MTILNNPSKWALGTGEKEGRRKQERVRGREVLYSRVPASSTSQSEMVTQVDFI